MNPTFPEKDATFDFNIYRYLSLTGRSPPSNSSPGIETFPLLHPPANRTVGTPPHPSGSRFRCRDPLFLPLLVQDGEYALISIIVLRNQGVYTCLSFPHTNLTLVDPGMPSLSTICSHVVADILFEIKDLHCHAGLRLGRTHCTSFPFPPSCHYFRRRPWTPAGHERCERRSSAPARMGSPTASVNSRPRPKSYVGAPSLSSNTDWSSL